MFSLTRHGDRHVNRIILLILLGLLTACSSNIKTYPNNLGKNLHVKTNSSVNTAVDIYQVNPDCSIMYSGTVKLDKADTDIGIPSDQSSYLAFVFSDSSWLAGSSSSTSYETLLRPRAGYTYEADVSYQDNIYNVVIHEQRLGSKKRRELETKSLSACSPL